MIELNSYDNIPQANKEWFTSNFFKLQAKDHFVITVHTNFQIMSLQWVCQSILIKSNSLLNTGIIGPEIY